MSPRKKPIKKRRKRRSRKARPGRLRRWLSLSAVAIVFLALGLLYLDVSVRARFDGRLWRIPSRAWSDPLTLSRGRALDADALVRRLQRSGHGSVSGTPARPGQFRRVGQQVQVFRRAFRTPFARGEAGRFTVHFDGGRVRSLTDEAGRRTDSVILEPELLATLYGERQEERRPVRLEEVPEPLIRAILAAEDSRFFNHSGLDARGIVRAAFSNLRRGSIVQGGSTITQQAVKNLYLGHERTWWRKLRESVITLILERRYSKQRILEVYLNEVYLGQRGSVAICGIQSASRFYFGRDIDQISLSESAMLAGMIRSPGRYNPRSHPERARARRDQVLDAMERLEFADPASLASARGEGLQIASGKGGYGGAPWVVDYVRRQIRERFPRGVLDEDGLEIYTTIDAPIQEGAEQALQAGLNRLDQGRADSAGPLEGALIVTHPRTGNVLALVGGRDRARSQFNRAIQARRQPGSCFKPFVYAAGFELARSDPEHGLTAATILEDEPLELVADGKRWRPANYDRLHRGAVTARTALVESLNVPTVRASQRVGLSRVIAAARASGIDSRMANVPSLALGTEEVTPLELATAYGTLARGGVRLEPQIVRAVVRGDGERIVAEHPKARRAMSAQTAFLVTDVLRGVFDEGTASSARRLGFDGTAAGKTGTTDDTRDAWFVGYTPELLALVWVGYDDGGKTGLTGATGALPIWVDLMGGAGSTGAGASFDEPPGIRTERIDPETGKLAVGQCPTVRDERFLEGSPPLAKCDLHQRGIKRWWSRWREKRRQEKQD